MEKLHGSLLMSPSVFTVDGETAWLFVNVPERLYGRFRLLFSTFSPLNLLK